MTEKDFSTMFAAHLLELLVRKKVITKEEGIELLKSVDKYMRNADMR